MCEITVQGYLQEGGEASRSTLAGSQLVLKTRAWMPAEVIAPAAVSIAAE
jgi:hypothetical protein